MPPLYRADAAPRGGDGPRRAARAWDERPWASPGPPRVQSGDAPLGHQLEVVDEVRPRSSPGRRWQPGPAPGPARHGRSQVAAGSGKAGRRRGGPPLSPGVTRTRALRTGAWDENTTFVHLMHSIDTEPTHQARRPGARYPPWSRHGARYPPDSRRRAPAAPARPTAVPPPPCLSPPPPRGGQRAPSGPAAPGRVRPLLAAPGHSAPGWAYRCPGAAARPSTGPGRPSPRTSGPFLLVPGGVT